MECFKHGALLLLLFRTVSAKQHDWWTKWQQGDSVRRPCRLPYQTEGKKPADLMSLKDLCTIDILPELIDAGIDSFKIEGRMKRPEYVYTVVKNVS